MKALNTSQYQQSGRISFHKSHQDTFTLHPPYPPFRCFHMSSWKKNGADKNDQGHLRSKFPFLHPSSVQVIEGHSKTTQKPRVAPRVARFRCITAFGLRAPRGATSRHRPVEEVLRMGTGSVDSWRCHPSRGSAISRCYNPVVFNKNAPIEIVTPHMEVL